MQNFKKMQLFVIGSFFIVLCCEAKYILLESLPYKTDKQKVSSLPGLVSAVAAGYGYYHFLTMQVGATQEGNTVPLMRKIDEKVRGTIVGILSRKILKHSTFDQQRNSLVCQSTEGILIGGIWLAATYGFYRIVSGVSRITHTLANRDKWAMHLAYTLQEQVKVLAALNSIRSEFTELVGAFEDQNISAIITASNVIRKLDLQIEEHSATLAAILGQVAELTNHYAHVSHCRLFDRDIQAVIHAVDHDVYALTQGDNLDRAGVIACVNDNYDLLKAITALYESHDLMYEGSYTSLWKGARKINDAMRDIVKYSSRVLRRNDSQLNDALNSCERMLWLKSKLLLLPILNKMVRE
ncbi:hypothetical protein KC460_00635 [Candidatus Dependentiae bacterium]|nr:hypothetical protein [Candidatus Dependentiae bacterium]